MIALSKQEPVESIQQVGNQIYYDGFPTCLYCGTLLDDKPETPVKTSIGYVCGGCIHDYMFTCQYCGKILPEKKRSSLEDELDLCEKCCKKTNLK